jgi:hypothetical protein
MNTYKIVKEALEANGAGFLDVDYSAEYMINNSFRDGYGETFYNLTNTKNGYKVFIREDYEYNFIAEELEKVI